MKSSNSELNIVLVEPEIPQNTGNVGRTCVGLGATLHLVGKLGFSLSEKEIRRSGLDYWVKVKLVQHESWTAFLKTLPAGANMYLFSTHGKKSFWETTFSSPAYLVFGAESHGFPKSFYTEYEKSLVRIPVSENIRSLNLATAVGAAAFEAARQWQGK